MLADTLMTGVSALGDCGTDPARGSGLRACSSGSSVAARGGQRISGCDVDDVGFEFSVIE